MSEHSEYRWYVVHTYSGYENKVKSNLEMNIANNPELAERIKEVFIPTETVVEIKNSKRREVERKIMPGYVLVKMDMSDRAWYIVRNTRGVTGFVGPDNKHPTPITDAEKDAMCQLGEHTRLDIQVGDYVRLLSGPFTNQKGKVVEFLDDKRKVKVVVSWASAEVPVEVASDEIVLEF